MQIHHIIRTRRQALGLTQEALAQRLGVSAPAVNKWEKALNYPDITLLPTLARVLGVDLNTLLSFQEDLTDEEIGLFLNQLLELGREQGHAAAFQAAFDKLREFPGNDRLAYSVAGILNGLLVMGMDEGCQQEDWQEQVDQLYRRCAGSTDSQVREQAICVLASREMNGGTLEQAEHLIEQLSDLHPQKQELLAILRKKQGNLSEAWQIWERSLFVQAHRIQTVLLQMLDLALETNDLAAARNFTDVAEQSGRLFELGEYMALAAPFQLAMTEQNGPHAMELLEKILEQMQDPYFLQHSSLYRHLPVKKGVEKDNFMLQGFLNALKQGADGAFLRTQPGFEALLEKYHL